MKYLLAFLVVLMVAWRWRTARTARHLSTPHKQPSAADGPVDMVRCGHCGVHLPASEAIASANERYCSQAHQRQAEP